MKKNITLFLLMLIVSAVFAQIKLDGPQKIVIDEERDRYIVSNFYSGGDLIQIDSLGNLSYFAENAGMVDGLQIIEDTIYGSAKDGIVKGFDLNTGLEVMSMDLSPDGVEFVSGFVADSSGYLYVSERWGDRIFKINPVTKDYWVFVEGNGLDEPNGLLYEPENNRIIICLDNNNPPILAVSLLDSTITTLTTTTLGGSDGIAKDKDGYYYVTGYYLHAIYKFAPDFSGDPEVFYIGDYIVYPTYNEEHNSLLITLYNEDDWAELLIDPTSVANFDSKSENTQISCYPNPFSDYINIEFELENPSMVRLEVCDQNGRIIRLLIDDMKYTEKQLVTWDGKSAIGEKVSNGLYYLKLTINGNIVSQNTIVISN
jgi:DNA-binding beta-propeller fold protein YncE